MREKRNIKIKNIGIVLGAPCLVYLLMELMLMLFFDTHLITSKLEAINLVKTTCSMACAAMALSINMCCGRMDFSLGAQQMIACVAGGTLAYQLGFGPIGVVITIVLAGMLAGGLVGALFVITRIPSMVLGIGMALIYECISFAISVNGFQLYGHSEMRILGTVEFEVIATVIAVLLFYIVFSHTRFGYHYRSIQGSQTVARSMGIDIFKNCIICYALSGGFMAMAGLFDTAYKGIIMSEMGLVSTAGTFTALFPVFVANFLDRYVDRSVALLIGALTVRILSYGLVVCQISAPMVTVVTYICLLMLLAVQGVYAKHKEKETRKNRRMEALQQLNV